MDGPKSKRYVEILPGGTSILQLGDILHYAAATALRQRNIAVSSDLVINGSGLLLSNSRF